MIKKLEAVGGQNPVEAAKLGCKIYHGPYIYNFQELYEFLSNKNFSEKIINEKELSQKIIRDFNENMKMSDSQVENINRIGKKILKDTCDEIQLLIN